MKLKKIIDKFKDNVKKIIKNRIKSFKEIRKHRKEVFRIYRILNNGKLKWHVYLHDLNKYILLFIPLPTKVLDFIHRIISPHHVEGINIFPWKDWWEIYADWESKIITKEDGIPALEYCKRNYPEYSFIIEGINDIYWSKLNF